MGRPYLSTSLRIIAACALVAGGLSAAGTLPHAQTGDHRLATARRHASEVLEALRQSTGVPGIAAAVVMDGRLVWSGTEGVVDLESRRPVTEATAFRIGSVSKVLTAAALGRLMDQKRMDIDAPVTRYVPGFPRGDSMTARLLAGHLGGIRSYVASDFRDSAHIDRRHFTTTREALSIFQDDALVAAPGEQYHYTVFGFTLLAAALEEASGQSFLRLMEDQVFKPLALTATGPDRQNVPNPALATPYERSQDGSASRAEAQDPSYKWAGGGMVSNAVDLARFGAAYTDGGYLSAATRELSFTVQTTASGLRTGVGLAWRLTTDTRGRAMAYHAGNIAGGRAVVAVYPEHDVAVAITTNQSLTPIWVEASAQALVEPYLRIAEGVRALDRVTLSGEYAYAFQHQGRTTRGTLEFGTHGRMTIPLGVAEVGRRFGARVDTALRVLPVLMTESGAFIPIIAPLGALGLDAEFGEDDFEGRAIGLFAEPFRGTMTARRR